jgi:hypothetical protein
MFLQKVKPEVVWVFNRHVGEKAADEWADRTAQGIDAAVNRIGTGLVGRICELC